MQYKSKQLTATQDRSDCLVVPYLEGPQAGPAGATLEASDKGLGALLKREGFSGKLEQTLLLHNPQATGAKRLLLVGLGASEVTPKAYQKAVNKALSALQDTPCKNLSFCFDELTVQERDTQWKARQLAMALGAGQYRFSRCKSKAPEVIFKPGKLVYACADKASVSEAQAGLDEGAAIAEGSNLARELGNLPGNICTPSYLASEAKRLGKDEDLLKIKVLDEKQMRELGMGSLLSVSAGSEQPAKLIVMEYRGGDKNQPPLALVGKGITFDTGGISLKPGEAMDEMKFDMCGAASVFGCVQALLKLRPRLNLVAVVAAAENMPGSRATKPGDIVTSMSGQTIEILNTDAEGRLVLCDALTYVESFKPEAVVDIATLTGACIIALGQHASGLYSNQEALAEALLAAGDRSGDRAWRLPLWDEYQPQLDSNFADMANIGGREAGSVTAACFLSRFTKNYPWAHLDVAGTAWNRGKEKGATGRPVPLLMHYLLAQLEQASK